MSEVRGSKERSYPTSKVRGSNDRSYPTSEVGCSGGGCQAAMVQERPRGGTPRPRSGAAAGRSYPTPEARGGGREKQPHLQGTVAAQGQEGLEELFHVQGQKGWQ